MSVQVAYLGRFGNNLLEYTCARLFAEENNLTLMTKWNHENTLSATTPRQGRVFNTPVTVIGDSAEDILNKKWQDGSYLLKGYFQKWRLYQGRRERIKSFFNLSSEPINAEDIVVHARLGDFRILEIGRPWGGNRVIDASWYLKCLEMEKFKQLYVVTEKYEPYLARFKKHNPVILCGRKWFEDWTFIRRFERAIISNGTFAWTAAFLGNAKKVYMFQRGISDIRQDLCGMDYVVQVDGLYEGETEANRFYVGFSAQKRPDK